MNPQSPNSEVRPPRPRIFIASSVEGLPIAEAIHFNLEHDAEVTVWTHLVFRPSEFPVESLERALNNQDFAIFVFSPDDILQIRNKEFQAVRDNVIFELGISIGMRGRFRNFIIVPRSIKDLHIPTDLLGINTIQYDDVRTDDNLAAAVSTACYQIKEAMKKNEPLKVYENGTDPKNLRDVNSHFTGQDVKGDPSQESTEGKMLWSSCAHFFHARFQRAFPGLRHDYLDERDPKMIRQRLERLLQAPLTFPKAKGSLESPLWWWRGEEVSPIKSFEITKDGKYLVDLWELDVSRVVAVDTGVYWNSFVYVEASPLELSGVNPFTREYIDRCVNEVGYCHEEVALFREGYIAKRFYDDGAVEINGELIDLNGEASLRLRPLSSFNFIIAGHDSAITSYEFEDQLVVLLDSILRGGADINDLIKSAQALPKNIGDYASSDRGSE